MSQKFKTFTRNARSSLALAEQEAHRLSHESVSAEHMMLGLLKQNDGVAIAALRRLGFDISQMYKGLDNALQSGYYNTLPSNNKGLTLAGKKAIELAVNEAHKFGHNYIGTEHLLLGLLIVSDGAFARVIAAVNVESVRMAVRDIHKRPEYRVRNVLRRFGIRVG